MGIGLGHLLIERVQILVSIKAYSLIMLHIPNLISLLFLNEKCYIVLVNNVFKYDSCMRHNKSSTNLDLYRSWFLSKYILVMLPSYEALQAFQILVYIQVYSCLVCLVVCFVSYNNHYLNIEDFR